MKTDQKVWDWRSYILHYAPDNATYKHLLLTLSCYMDSTGASCFPSIDTLEKVTSLSRPTIIKYLKKASKDGWLKIEQHGYAGQQWKRNEYTASIPEKVVKEINRVEKGGKTDSERQLTSQKKVVKEVNSISPYNNSSNISSNKTFTRELEDSNTKEELLEIWLAYRKKKGKHANLYEQDVLLNKEWKDKSITEVKEAILYTVSNGWITLQWPDKSQTNGQEKPVDKAKRHLEQTKRIFQD